VDFRVVLLFVHGRWGPELKQLCAYSLLMVVLAFGGCKSTPKPVPIPVNIASNIEATVAVSSVEAWAMTRDALVEQGYEIYTRDKSGLFIAYTKEKRNLLLVPHRTQFTIVIEEVTGETSRVAIESVRQRYKISFLSYPGWVSDVEKLPEDTGQSIIDALNSKVAAN